MKPLNQEGVYEDRGLYFTTNKSPGRRIYGEKLRAFKGKEYRSWSPYRSKMAALMAKDRFTPWVRAGEDILYLGASTGTTVSHLSDLLDDTSRLYAVEFSARSTRDLLWNLEGRTNVIPIMADANDPALYQHYIDQHVGALIQDVAQRHQLQIFLRNLPFLKSGGFGFLFVKARSIHVAKPVELIVAEIAKDLEAAGLLIEKQVALDPFERDHVAFVVRKP